VSRLTFDRFIERISRLYEQGADEVRIGEYVRHWLKWVRSGVGIQLKPFKVGESRGKYPPAPHPFKNLISLSPF
jgi:hypothetical protein